VERCESRRFVGTFPNGAILQAGAAVFQFLLLIDYWLSGRQLWIVEKMRKRVFEAFVGQHVEISQFSPTTDVSDGAKRYGLNTFS
jgi:hypothetical protein